MLAAGDPTHMKGLCKVCKQALEQSSRAEYSGVFRYEAGSQGQEHAKANVLNPLVPFGCCWQDRAGSPRLQALLLRPAASCSFAGERAGEPIWLHVERKNAL